MKKIFFVLAFMLLLCVTGNVFAQNNADVIDSSVKVIEGNADNVVANVDFEKVTVKQNEKDQRQITISFDIVNHHTKVLSNLVNSVQVLKGQRVFYEEVMPGTATIAPRSSIKEVIHFTAPKFIGGNVSLRIVGADRTGLVLEDYIVDNINLPQQDTKSITVHDCSFFVNNKDQFLLSDGVDISPQEKLSIECDVDNDSDQDITYTPEINIYAKSIYSGKVEKTWKGKEEIFTKQSTKTVNFEMPLPQSPGYYDARLNFLNDNDKVVTGVVAHFVLQGQSASLSFVSFDKQQYKKGDIITAKVLIAGSADSFPGARNQKSMQPKSMTLKGSIESEGKKCAEDIEKDISGKDGTYNVIIEKKATRDCKKPVASIALYDENGQLLDSNEYKLYTETKNVVKQSSSQSNNSKTLSKTIMLIFALLFIIALATWLIYLTKKHHSGSIGLFVLIMTLGILMGAHSVHAGVTVQCGPSSLNDHGYCYYDVSPTGDCSTMRGEARISWNVCQNHKRSLEIQWRPTVNDQFESLVRGSEIYVRQCSKKIDNNGNICYKKGAHGCANKYSPLGHCPHDAYLAHAIWGTSIPQKVQGGNCIKDSDCDKTFYGFYCPDCNNMQDYNNRFLNVGSGMLGYGLKSAQVTKTVGSGNHVARFRFMFRDLKDHKDDTDVYYNAPYTVPQCPPVNGKCTSASPYTYNANQTTWPAGANNPTYFCESGTPTITPTQSNFPNYGQTVTWDCIGKNGGTSTQNGACKATRQMPAAKCGTAKGIETNTKPTANLCPPNHTASDPQIVNVNGHPDHWQWTCTHNVTGATPQSETCRAPIPGAECGSAHTDDPNNITNIKPTAGLCAKQGQLVCSWPGRTLPDVSLQNDGWWHWQCEHNPQAYPQKVDCHAPTCLVNMPIKYTNPVIISNNMRTTISLNCPGSNGNKLCCKIHNTTKGSIPEKTICTGDSGEIEIVEGENEFDAECWFDKNNSKTKDPNEPPVKKDFKVQTACIESQCTANGTCAKAPKIANSRSKCKSSCNSNADCTSGRIIETRP